MNDKKTIFVIDDDTEINLLMKLKLEKSGYKVITETNPLKALETITLESIDLVIVDKNMPEIDGIEILKHIKSFDSSIPVIVMTGDASVDSAIEAIKQGAFHYITKPINYDELGHIIKQAIENKSLKEENIRLKEILREEIITENSSMKKILEKARKISSFDVNVLITGESGTGKELLAKFIHRNSKRKDRPFVAINCGAIPADLLESELFGFKKGSFTGATSDKKGLIAEAEGGTLFLDEIGELPLKLQVKLLRLLQEKEYIPLGETKPKKADVRFIAATNRNLEEMVKEGSFREDLYFRLNTITFKLPPLRERKEDIIPLSKFFIKKISLKYEIPEKVLSKSAISQLLSYNWPGNIRELEGTIERTILMTDEPLINEIIFENAVSKTYKKNEMDTDEFSLIYSEDIKPFKQLKEEFEKKYFENLLKKTNYNISKASKLSGKTRAEIYRLIKKYNLSKK